ncbi:Golgi-associated plant pathogenesis-related protein 1-like isoform X1 [Ascaphus truei]|uniref:Golgi-associated plant pathogenesis-related protein 1-like isoform X1 n=2 Tax=Ascaphus truei TaxID=8439 RepID=UPI003F5AC4B9
MASNAGVNMSQFEQTFLASHNTYRAKHKAPPLQLNRDICNSAQKWADHLLSIHTMKHSGSEYGENLYWMNNPSAKELAGNLAVDAWYNEIKDYNFSKPGFSGTTGHFTQVVWKDSTQLGVGLATDGKGVFYVVGQYNPHGNVTNAGYFERNVLPS